MAVEPQHKVTFRYKRGTVASKKVGLGTRTVEFVDHESALDHFFFLRQFPDVTDIKIESKPTNQGE